MRNFGYTLPFLPLLLYIGPISSTFRNSQLKCFASPIPTANLCSTGLNLLTQLLPQLSLCCLLLTTDRVRVSSSNRGSNFFRPCNTSYNTLGGVNHMKNKLDWCDDNRNRDVRPTRIPRTSALLYLPIALESKRGVFV